VASLKVLRPIYGPWILAHWRIGTAEALHIAEIFGESKDGAAREMVTTTREKKANNAIALERWGEREIRDRKKKAAKAWRPII
jgi:hypothetical protein